MNLAIKQRLAGILVLGCLAIILISLLLDGEGIQAPPLARSIPAPPVLESTTVDAPVRPTITADSLPAPGTEAAPAPASTVTEARGAAVTPALPAFDSKETDAGKTAKKPPAQGDALEAAVASIMAKDKPAATPDSTPHLDASGLPQSFVVRLGSFADGKNANALEAKVVAAGHKAYIRTNSGPNGPLYVVYAGPVLTRAEAISLQTRLGSGLQLKGVVEPFVAKP